MTEPGDITLLLRKWSDGESAALAPLFEQAYPQLRRIAGALFRGERPENLLQPTAVVSELFLRLVHEQRLRIEDRQHFFNLSARLMRRILVDCARAEGRQKRNVGVMLPLVEGMAWSEATQDEVVNLDRVLDELGAIDSNKSRVIELRFFMGFTADETAELMGMSKATIDRDLSFARSWVRHRLERTAARTAGPIQPLPA